MKRTILFLLACLAAAGATAASKIVNKGNFGIAGWLVYWDPKSMEVYEKYSSMIDRVYPEWYVVGADSMPRSNEFNVEAGKPGQTAAFLAKKRRTVEIARAGKIQIF